MSDDHNMRKQPTNSTFGKGPTPNVSSWHFKNPFLQLTVGEKAKARCPDQGTCVQCGYISSQEVKNNIRPNCWPKIYLQLKVCKACVLLAGLNKGLPQLGVGKSSKHRKTLADLEMDQGSSPRREEVVTPLSLPQPLLETKEQALPQPSETKGS